MRYGYLGLLVFFVTLPIFARNLDFLKSSFYTKKEKEQISYYLSEEYFKKKLLSKTAKKARFRLHKIKNYLVQQELASLDRLKIWSLRWPSESLMIKRQALLLEQEIYQKRKDND